MNLGELRSYVRGMLDCDSSEITDFMLDAWIREGSDRVHRYTNWNWLQTTWTLSAAEPTVDFGDIKDADGSVPKHISFIHTGDEELLHQDSQHLMSLMFEHHDERGRPKVWSERGGRTLLLHPTPSTSETYTIQGVRASRDWMSEGVTGVPDMPEQLHYAIAFWAMGNAYQMLNDGQNANHNFERAQLTLMEVKGDTSSVEHGDASVVGGGSTYRPRHLRPARWVVEN